MFGIGMQELILVLVVALIILGPKKLPDVAKSLGKALNEFKRATSDIKESLEANHNPESHDALNDTQHATGTTIASASEITPPQPSPEETALRPMSLSVPPTDRILP
ncbi:MAG: twin-arginine translocase TatA/TatE family subunit [Pseudomonadota bacterium]